MRLGADVPKVLIVDDEHGNLVILDALLTDIGYRTVLASNGKLALAHFQTESPDIVLMDWMMPVQDGPTTAKLMREAKPHVAIIMMSGASEAQLRAIYPDFSAFLQKPFRAADVVAALQKAEVLDGS
jgi:CheY-like chemotaxis protein